MREIDLIPTEFAVLRGKRRLISTAMLVLALVIGVNLIAWGALRLFSSQVDKEVQRLSSMKDLSERQSGRLKFLRAEKLKLQGDYDLLQGLRGGVQVRDVLIAVDRSLEEGVWFDSWRFRREGIEKKVGEAPDSNGYFIILSADGKNKTGQTIEIQSQMTVRGHAKDHAALSAFVSRLVGQNEIAKARVVRTSSRPGDASAVIEFELAVEINTAGDRS